MKKLILKLSAIIICVFVLSIAIDTMYRKAYGLHYEWPNNIFILPEIAEKYTMVKVGNSHADDGITFDGYKAKTLSLSGVAQSFDYDLAYLKMHEKQIAPGAVIIITVSPLSFSQIKAGTNDSLQTNYYDGRISPFLIPNLNVGDYLQSRIFPFLRSGYLARERYMETIKQRITKEESVMWQNTAIPKKEVAEPVSIPKPIAAQAFAGKVMSVSPETLYFNVEGIEAELATPTAVAVKKYEDSMSVIYYKWYNSDGFGPQYFDANRKDLEQMIAYCVKMKWKPVLITIPVTQILLKGLNPDYMQKYVYENIAKTNRMGAPYFDFSTNTRIARDNFLFSNSDHLNESGAKVFSYYLLRTLIDNGYLSNDVDGYDYSPLWKNAGE